MKISHKLSNLVLRPSAFLEDYDDLLFRSNKQTQFDKEYNALSFSKKIDFLTYFNSCSLGKWRQYTNISNPKLHLVLSGDAPIIQFVAANKNNDEPLPLTSGQRLVFDERSYMGRVDGKDLYFFDLDLPESDEAVISFNLTSRGMSFIHDAFYYGEIEESEVNQVKLALSTTTFKKEDYIVPNINLVKNEIVNCDDPIADNFHMFVVDNGRTLDVESLSDETVTVLPNKNVGGSGGFARGMMEALSSDEGFTHVLLMDDDVKISTESLKRTYNLLALAKEEYRNAFINGAMLAIEKPNLQFEDVSYIDKSGVYRKVKENYFVNNVEDIAANESKSVEVNDAYGAWWYSCIPASVIKGKGLPLPLFVRCDDVEFGARTNPVFMTMNGICVWHEAFEGRFRASVDCYQYVRNFLIMIAVDDCASESMFIARMERNVRLHLRTMAYETAELLLDGFEDYLKGPKFLENAIGEEIMKKNGAKNEKLIPIEQLNLDINNMYISPKVLGRPKRKKDLDLKAESDKRVNDPLGHAIGFIRHNSMRFWRTLPYDRHYLPERLLSDRPKPILYSGLACCGAYTIGSKTLVALDRDKKNGAIRHFDKKRWNDIHKRLKELKIIHSRHGKEIRAAYKEAKPWLTSWDFWNEYLGTDLKPAE